MTPHDHPTIVPGCFRCDLGRDEAEAAEKERAALEERLMWCIWNAGITHGYPKNHEGPVTTNTALDMARAVIKEMDL